MDHFHIELTAITAITPLLSSGTSPEQEFISHWKAVTSYFIENKDHKVSIEHTGLSHHLNCMFERLQHGDHKDKAGPCLEYVLQHKILETLATLARTDTPPGMKQEVLLFFTKLLSRLEHPLLPQMHVHKPVQRLVRLCGEQRAGPTETEEIRFLCTLCAKLKAQPHLVGFFIESAVAPPSLVNGQTKSAITHQPGVAASKPNTVFPLVSSLLSLMHSHDARVAVKACEGLMLICSLREPTCGLAITHSTDLGRQLASKMAALYRVVPKNLSGVDVESAQAKWGFDLHMSREDDRYFPGKQQLLALLSWLDYCDELVSMAMPQVANEVARHIREDFLTACLKKDILQTSESGAVTSTSLLTRCLYCVHSKPLVSEFSHFILDEVQDVSPSPSHNHASSMRQRLIERCNHLSDQVSLCSLKLFDTLLLKSDPHIFETLLLNNLSTWPYTVKSRKSGHKELTNTAVQKEVPSSPVVKEVSGSPISTEVSSTPVPKEVLDSPVPKEVPDTASPKELLHTPVPKEVTSSPVLKEVSNTSVPTKVPSSPEHKQVSEVPKEVPSTSLPEEVPISPVQKEDSSCALSEEVPKEVGGTSTSEVQAEETQMEEEPEERQAIQKDSETKETDSDETEEAANGGNVNNDDLQKSLDGGEGDGLSPQHATETAASGVHRVVNSFLQLVPVEARSSTEAGDTGYDTYLRDAHQQYSNACLQCKDFKWSSQLPPQDKHSELVDTQTAFNEGEFLKMLLDRLARMLDQNYELNLQLTSVLSKLCLLPHPLVQEYFLDPSSCENSRTLYTVLTKLCSDLRERVKLIPNVKIRLQSVRKQLCLYDLEIKSVEDGELLAGIITLEEFSKELAAIAFVKHHQL